MEKQPKTIPSRKGHEKVIFPLKQLKTFRGQNYKNSWIFDNEMMTVIFPNTKWWTTINECYIMCDANCITHKEIS